MSDESKETKRPDSIIVFDSDLNIEGLFDKMMNDTYHNWIGFNKETDNNLNKMIRYYSLMHFIEGIPHRVADALIEGKATYEVVRTEDDCRIHIFGLHRPLEYAVRNKASE